MQQEQLRATLAELNFSERWSSAMSSKLAAMLSPAEFKAGEVLFSEGEDQPYLYWIVKGEVGLEMCIAARGCTRILTLGPGDLLAWSAVLGPGKMTSSAIAVTEVRTLAASSRDVLDLCDADHDFGYQFMRELAATLSKRLVATRLQLLDLYDVCGGRQAASSALPYCQ